MKILYIIKQDPEPTMRKIMDEHKKMGDVTVVDVRTEKDYSKIVDLIASSDKVVSV